MFRACGWMLIVALGSALGACSFSAGVGGGGDDGPTGDATVMPDGNVLQTTCPAVGATCDGDTLHECQQVGAPSVPTACA